MAGATTMPWFGRLIDRRGVRHTVMVVGVGLAAVLAAMAGVTGLVSLTASFVGIRILAQGALGLTATTSVAYWFDRRRGLAVGTVSAVGSVLLSLTPIVLALGIRGLGWRTTWLAAAAVVSVGVLAVGRRVLVDRPAVLGQRMDGVPGDATSSPSSGYTRADAARTPMFWTVTAAVVTTGLVGTGLAFHQISLLGERGLTPFEAAANFLPHTAAALLATLSVGALVDRWSPRILVLSSMALMAAAIVLLPVVRPGIVAAVWGAAVGASVGAARAVEAGVLPNLFGTTHLGSIRGLVHALAVAGTALEPLVLALGRELTGSYQPAVTTLLVLPALVVISALTAPMPGAISRPAPLGRRAPHGGRRAQPRRAA